MRAAGFVGQGRRGRGGMITLAAATQSQKLLESLELARSTVLLEREELGLDLFNEKLFFGAVKLAKKFF